MHAYYVEVNELDMSKNGTDEAVSSLSATKVSHAIEASQPSSNAENHVRRNLHEAILGARCAAGVHQ